MPLTLENGTGVTGADSFVTATQADAFSVDYFGAAVAGSDAAKDAALRRAFVVMSGLRWRPGVWPLFGGSIPVPVQNAQSVFARAELQSAGVLSPTITPGAKTLTKVGSIEWTPKDGSGVEADRPVVTMAFDLLRPWLEYDPSRDGSVGFTGIMSV